MNLNTIYKLYREYFSIDLRFLKYFRFIYVFCALLFLIEFVENFQALVGNSGFLGLETYLKNYSCDNCYSVLFISDSIWFYSLFFAIFILALVFVILNRNANFYFFVLAILMQGFIFRFRPFVFGGHNMIFWLAMIGAVLPHKMKETNKYFGISSLVVFMQIFSIYFQSGIYKVGPSWHDTYTSLEAALRNPIYKTNIGFFFADFIWANKFLTRLTILIEVYGSILFIFGFLFGRYAKWYKFIFCISLIAFHSLTFLFLDLSFFPLISIALLVLAIDLPWQFSEQVSFLQEKKYFLLSLVVMAFVFFGIFGVSLSKLGLPTQKFNYFSKPLNQFVNLSVVVDADKKSIILNPLSDQNLNLTTFYTNRLNWNMSMRNLKSNIWVDYYCKKFSNSKNIQLIYNWIYFDNTNSKVINNKSFNQQYSCTDVEY